MVLREYMTPDHCCPARRPGFDADAIPLARNLQERWSQRCHGERKSKRLVALPLDVLDRLDVFEEASRGARKVQDATIGAMYDVIRKVDDEVASSQGGSLAGSPAHKRRSHVDSDLGQSSPSRRAGLANE